jgi:hypothetical protein
MNTDRYRMAELIAENGVMDGARIRAALDWEFGRIRAAVRDHDDQWFVLTAEGWDLTAEGRKALEKVRTKGSQKFVS